VTRRAFTVQEANGLIHRLESIIDRLSAVQEEIEASRAKLQVLDVLWGRKILEPVNPDHSEFLELRRRIQEDIVDSRLTIQSEILGRGLRFPAGGLEHGLVDFPTTFQGRWVYLCWRRGEPEIRWWHEVHAGFAGRQPLSFDQALRMGREDDPAEVDDSLLDF
jgi:hypothetical protein